MTEQCFSSRGSYPPVCEVHKVAVVQRQVSIDQFAPNLGRVTCSLCPVSRAVVREVRSVHAKRTI